MIGAALRRLPEFLGDAGLLLFVVLALPLGILLIGTPIVLLVRLLLSLVQRW